MEHTFILKFNVNVSDWRGHLCEALVCTHQQFVKVYIYELLNFEREYYQLMKHMLRTGDILMCRRCVQMLVQ